MPGLILESSSEWTDGALNARGWDGAAERLYCARAHTHALKEKDGFWSTED